MSNDPNGNRWSKSESNVGKNMLRKFGWSEGEGLGKDQAGMVSHVKVSRKDDVMGIGYTSSVHETWTTQSVGFADVLDRIKRTATLSSHSTDADEEGAAPDADADAEMPSGRTTATERPKEHASTPASPTSPTGSRHFAMYAKRNALKTELLQSSSAHRVEEILGRASSSASRAPADHSTRAMKRGRDGKDMPAGSSQRGTSPPKASVAASTLRSPLLQRLMVRCVEHEPHATATEDHAEVSTENSVCVTKPNPRPPRCSDTPFLLQR